MSNILVTEFTHSLGMIAPVVFAKPEDAANYIGKHIARNKEIDAENKDRPVGEKWGKTGIEIFATAAAPGKYKTTVGMDITRISPSVTRQIREHLSL